MTVEAPATIPAVSYFVPSETDPHLLAWECKGCGARYLDWRMACPSCSGNGLDRVRMSTSGTVRAFTIVHRAYPGVTTPFIAVIVELDGGGVVKANLVDVDVEPSSVHVGQPVHLVQRSFGTDGRGVEAIGFAFRPTETEGAGRG